MKTFTIPPRWKADNPTDYYMFLFAGLNPKKADRCAIVPYIEADSGKLVKAYCIVHKKSAEREMGPDFMEMIKQDPYSFIREMEDSPRMRIKKIHGAPFPLSVAFSKKPEMLQLPGKYHGYVISSAEKNARIAGEDEFGF